jgi:hypothetical protein
MLENTGFYSISLPSREGNHEKKNEISNQDGTPGLLGASKEQNRWATGLTLISCP